MKKYDKRLSGFTLVEMTVALALFAIISVILSQFLSQSLSAYRIKKTNSELQEKAAHVMREFEKETRAATKILTANSNELKFYRYFDLTSPSPTQVRYFISGTKFEIGLTLPQGTEPIITYPILNEKIDLIVPDVTNTTSIFRYYDGNGIELVTPVDTTKVRMIELKIVLDENPDKPPVAVEESTMVNLRNVKDNL